MPPKKAAPPGDPPPDSGGGPRETRKTKGAASKRVKLALEESERLASIQAEKAQAKALRRAAKRLSGTLPAGTADAPLDADRPRNALERSITALPFVPMAADGLARPAYADVVNGAPKPQADPAAWLFSLLPSGYTQSDIVGLASQTAIAVAIARLAALEKILCGLLDHSGDFSPKRLDPVRGLLLQLVVLLAGEWFQPFHSAYDTGNLLEVLHVWRTREGPPFFTIDGFNADEPADAMRAELGGLRTACQRDMENFSTRKDALIRDEAVTATALKAAAVGALPERAPANAVLGGVNAENFFVSPQQPLVPAGTQGPQVNDLLSLLASRTAPDVVPVGVRSGAADPATRGGDFWRPSPSADAVPPGATRAAGGGGYGLPQPPRRDARAMGGEGDAVRDQISGAAAKECVMTYVLRICPPLEQCLTLDAQLERARQRQLAGIPPPKRGEEALFSPAMDLHTFQKACQGYAAEFLHASPQATSEYLQLIDTLCALHDRVPMLAIMDFEYVVRQLVALNKCKFTDAHPSSQVWLKYLSPALTRAALIQDDVRGTVDGRRVCPAYLTNGCMSGKLEGGGCGGIHACPTCATISNGAQGCTLCRNKTLAAQTAERQGRNAAAAAAAAAATADALREHHAGVLRRQAAHTWQAGAQPRQEHAFPAAANQQQPPPYNRGQQPGFRGGRSSGGRSGAKRGRVSPQSPH